jgi:alkanesulfonate monooxygenase
MTPAMTDDSAIEVFSTCPHSSGVPPDVYLERVIEIARWSDEAGCKGILVYSDNNALDPWHLSHIILQHTKTLCPLVAVQPIYMHPYWVAKQLTTLAHLYGRQLYLNMVAGGFKNDLDALNDTTPHDQRYARLIEYTEIIMGLVKNPEPFSYDGDFHTVSKLKLAPPLPEALVPGVFVSGSSEAGVAAAKALGATAIKYPKPASEEDPRSDDVVPPGIRVGIIARHEEAKAWDTARARFPEDRKGQLTRNLATKVSDSVWHKQLSDLDESQEKSPYWMVPFNNYKTMCPYLVGSYDQVADELARYFHAGYRTVILDIPPDAEELTHTFAAFDRATQPQPAL